MNEAIIDYIKSKEVKKERYRHELDNTIPVNVRARAVYKGLMDSINALRKLGESKK